MINKKFTLSVLFLLTLMLSSVAEAVPPTVTSNGIDGRLVSYSLRTGGAGSAHVIATTPPAGNFVLTKFCAYGDAFVYSTSMDFIGAIIGTTSGPDQCVSYEPGIVIPAGDELLVSTGGSTYIAVTGIQVLP